MSKLAVIISHPIQYYAPWFRFVAEQSKIELKVFYLWDFGVTDQIDEGFRRVVRWDVPLLSGYEYEFVENTSRRPGSSHYWGMQNPTLVSRVTKWRPDAVLVVGYKFASLMRFITLWNTQRTPLIFRGDSHRLHRPQGARAQAQRALIAALFRRFRAFIYVGKANREYFNQHKVEDEKLFFTPHAVNNDFFQRDAARYKLEAARWRQELGIASEHKVVAFAGKFDSKKRPLDLLRAFMELDQSGLAQNCVLLFVGSGEIEEELRRAAGDHPRIRFAPFQNQTEMPRVYYAADLFVLPSYGGSETWGLAVNEAMCCGCAIITSTHVGCTDDLVHPHHNGLSFPAGDVTALTAALCEALTDNARLRQWGEESKRIIASYNYTEATRGLEQAIDYAQSN